MIKHEHKIWKVLAGSIAEELGLEPGDVVLSVNGKEIEDIFDYDFLCQDTEVNMLVRAISGEEVLLEIEKDEDEDLGIRFENGLMDDYKSCSNKCIFCFIDQMPPGMRETLYFKDDDSRLSFLQGNYVTLTNMKQEAIDRIISYRLAPINISVHTTNPELRCRMLKNRFAGDVLRYIRTLYEAGIEMNGQIVLCPGWNDGEELKNTLKDLKAYLPLMRSVSVVPLGMTKYREGLEKLTPVTREVAEETIEIVEAVQREVFPEYGLHFVHASDEFYILAGRDVPEEERYDGYIQLENGVGMLRLLKEEFAGALASRTGDDRKRKVSIASGKLMAPYLEELISGLVEKYPNAEAMIYPIRNDFFGEQITVAGLLTGQDLISQLRGKDLGEVLLLPWNMLRSGESVFLDDLKVSDLERELKVHIHITGSEGKDLLAGVLGEDDEAKFAEYSAYEQGVNTI